jgi:hypothetical protein
MPFGFLSALTALDPVMVLQGIVLSGAFILLFLLLYTLRDIILRTHSFWFQAFCVLLTGALPIAGFLVYLLIRPARTIKERELEDMVRDLAGRPMEGEHAHYAEDGPTAEPADPTQPTL